MEMCGIGLRADGGERLCRGGSVGKAGGERETRCILPFRLDTVKRAAMSTRPTRVGRRENMNASVPRGEASRTPSSLPFRPILLRGEQRVDVASPPRVKCAFNL